MFRVFYPKTVPPPLKSAGLIRQTALDKHKHVHLPFLAAIWKTNKIFKLQGNQSKFYRLWQCSNISTRWPPWCHHSFKLLKTQTHTTRFPWDILDSSSSFAKAPLFGIRKYTFTQGPTFQGYDRGLTFWSWPNFSGFYSISVFKGPTF